MDKIKQGDLFFDPETGRRYRIRQVLNYFLYWDVMVPGDDGYTKSYIQQPIQNVLGHIKGKRLIIDTEAARLLYVKEE